MATITLKGLNKLQRKIDDVADLGNLLKDPMNRSLFKLQNRMADYPPKPAGSTYVRTGTLGRRWTSQVDKTVTVRGTGIEGRIGNNTEYGPMVQSSQFQSIAHRGRWQTDEQVVTDETKWIITEFSNAIEDKLK